MTRPLPAAATVALTPPSRYAGAWAALADGLPRAAPLASLGLGPGDRVLVVAAHPDDETLGAGGLLASLAASGVATHVLALSAGEAAFDHVGLAVPGLGERRKAELAAAGRCLGAASTRCADLPDGRLDAHPGALTETIAAAADEHRVDHVLTVWWDDPHPDHRAAGAAARRAAACRDVPVSGYPVWAPHWTDPVGLPDPTAWSLVDLGRTARSAKQAALAAYSSQTRPVAGHMGPVVPAEVARWPHELVVRR